MQAREAGATVRVLERFEGGGATMLSGGIIYSGGGTRQQQAAGVNDSAENMFNYLKLETHGAVPDQHLREFCESSASLSTLAESATAMKAPMAHKMGFDPDKLSEAVSLYNQAARGEAPDPQRKGEEFLREIKDGPFYALDISKTGAKFPLAVLSFGGLKVDESTSGVLREDGSVIEGLYAVGRAAAGLPSNHYMSGFAIADCVFTGRKAARAAAGGVQKKKAGATFPDSSSQYA